MQFEELDLNYDIRDALDDMNFVECTPIQEQAIRPLLEGRDLIGVAQTGTGKTAAYLLPVLSQLRDGGFPNDAINCVIMAPTRELAQQIDQAMEGFSYYLENVSSIAVYGGNDGSRFDQETKSLRGGAPVVIATPGRLLSHLKVGTLDLSRTSFFVLDEADRMLDMGFIHDIRKVVALLPQNRQNLFFSATMPDDITKLAATILRPNPVRVEVAPQSTPIERIHQELYRIDKRRKGALLKELLLAHPEMKKVLVFSRTKHGADKITRVLEKAGIKCAAIHGNKSQNRRQEALGNFKCEQIRVLVATDIAARGIDVDDVSHVFNYDLPDVPETFVHRIGRTARAGKDGIAISFCAPDEEQDLRAIEKLTRISIPEGDKTIFEKLPPPQKETPESEMRNARGRGFPKGNHHGNKPNRGELNRHENRGGDRRGESNREGHNTGNPQNAPHSKQKPQNQQKHQKPQIQQSQAPQNREKPNGGIPQNQEGRRTIGRNRPGSRARKRMREAAKNQQ